MNRLVRSSLLLASTLAPLLHAQAPLNEENDTPPAEAAETLEDIIVTASAERERYLATRGTTTRIGSQTMVETGVQDLGSMVKYDPTVFIPFDMTTGDGAVGYAASGASSFNIRGIEGNRISIEVDGIRQPPEYLSTSFDMGEETGSGGMGRDYFDPSMFQLVEVVKGGASALYSSDALGGAVSMKTLDPADLYGDKGWGGLARLQFFSRNDGLAWQLGGAHKVGPVEYLLVYAGRDTNETSNHGRTPPDPMTVESGSWLAKVGYDAGDHLFQLTYERYERNVYADMQSALHSPNQTFFRPYTRSVENWQDVTRDRLSLKWTWQPLGAGIDGLETQAYWQDSTSASRNLSTNPDRQHASTGVWYEGRNRKQWIDFDTEIQGISSFARKSLETANTRHHFLLGLDASIESSANRFYRQDTEGYIDRVIIDGVGVPVPSTRPGPLAGDRISFDPADTTRAGLIFQNDMSLGSRWEMTPGLRLDYYGIENSQDAGYLTRLHDFLRDRIPPEMIPDTSEDYDDLSLSPRFDVAFKPTENSRIYAGYAFGVRNPTAEERSMIFEHPSGAQVDGETFDSITIPNPDLGKETSHALKLGYKAENDHGRFGMELFYTRYQDFIEKEEIATVTFTDSEGNPTTSVITTTANQGGAEIYGIEGGGEWNPGAWQPALEGFSLGLNAGYTIGNNLSKDQPLNTVDPWKAVGYLGYADPGGVYGARLIGTYTAAVTRTDDTSPITGRMFRPEAWFTLDLVAWWRPVEGLTLNAGINNLFDEQYYNWSTIRRGGGHYSLPQFGGNTNSVNDRLTAPGRNFFVAATWQF